MLFMVRCGATDNVRGALRAALPGASSVAAGTAPPTFGEWVESNPLGRPDERLRTLGWSSSLRNNEFSRIEGIETGGTD